MGNSLSKFHTPFSSKKHFPFVEDLSDWLSEKTLKDISTLEDQHLISFTTGEDLHSCFGKLVEYNIHSAPVWDPEKKEYVGLIDWKDFARYVLEWCEICEAEEGGAKLHRILDEKSHKRRKAIIEKNPTAFDIVNFSGHNPYYPIWDTTPLYNVLQSFAQNGVHRRPVLSIKDKETIKAMVSQSSLLKYFVENLDKFPPTLMEKPIEDVVAESTSDSDEGKLDFVLSVLEDASMKRVLKILVEHDVNGVAVVDKECKLVGNVSVSDLQYLVHEHLPNLDISVKDWLETVPRKKIISCGLMTPLKDVFVKIATENVSRLYVLNSDGCPVSVVTMTDLFDAILSLTSKEE